MFAIRNEQKNLGKIRNTLESTFFTPEQADWLVRNHPQYSEFLANGKASTNQLFDAIRMAEDGLAYEENHC